MSMWEREKTAEPADEYVPTGQANGAATGGRGGADQGGLSFEDLDRSVDVTIRDKHYVLREASGGAAKKYRAASLADTEMVFNDDDGTRAVRRLQALSEVESLLVSLCLYEQLPDGKQRPIPRDVVESWPARVQKALFEKAKEISDLDEREDLPSLRRQHERLGRRIARLEEAEARAKNAPSGSTAG